MHEYGIANDIYATARRAAIEHNASVIQTIHVEIGELSMINPEQVEFLFSVIVEDDPLFVGTVFQTVVVPPQTTCSCGYTGSEIYVCPSCGALPEVIKGREILVSHIEIDTKDGEEA